jgi:4-amino-4-deoxy-L-arabinose transferase-like glycosyltransferase
MTRSVQSDHVFRHALLVTALCLVTFFAGLGRSAIGDADEAFYAQSAREMVEQGDWITPHYNYEYRFQKPVFFYWLVAGTYLVAGVNETAARFPSALAGLALALMTWAVGRRWVGPQVGVVGGAIVATSFGYFTIAHASLPDLPLAAFITLATWALFEAGAPAGDPAAPSGGTASAAPDDRTRRRWTLLAGFAIGVGMLTKGPVALVLPVLVYLIAHLVMADGLLPTRRGWFGLRWIDVALAALVLLAVALPWFLAMAEVHGPAYLRRFFIGENLERFATERYNGRRPLWFYAPIIFGGLAPWSSLMVLWIPPLGRVLRGVRRLTELEWRLILWAVVPVVFYTLSVGQQPRYILPVLPPLAVLVARTLVRRLAPSPARSPPARSRSSPSRSCCSAPGRCSSRCPPCKARSAPPSSSSRRWPCSGGRGWVASACCPPRWRCRRRPRSSRCSSRSTRPAGPSRCS